MVAFSHNLLCQDVLWSPFRFCLHTWEVITPVWPHCHLQVWPPTLTHPRVLPFLK